MSIKLSGFVFGLLALLASGSLVAQTYPLGQQSPTSFSINNNPGICTRGYRFQCNASNVTVVSLGCYYPTAASPHTITLTLWNYNTQAILGQVTTTTQGQWSFVTLPSPVTLSNGGMYIVTGYQTTGPYYFSSFTAPSTWLPTGTIQYMDMRYSNGGTATSFPTSTLSNYQYGVVDFGYTTGPTVSTSTTNLNLGTAYQGQASTPVSYTVSGSSLTAGTSITAPANVEISFSQTTGYASSLNVATTGTWGPTTVWARIVATAPLGAVSGNIVHSSTGANTVNVAVTGNVTTPPVLNVNPNSLILGTSHRARRARS